MNEEKNTTRFNRTRGPSIACSVAMWADMWKTAKTKLKAGTIITRLLALDSITSLALLSACTTQSINTNSQKQDYAAETFLREPISLGINGFNYTDAAIDSFSVNSVWGGNIYVSTLTSGGGGTTCCYTLHTLSSHPIPINIKWMRYSNQKQHWCHITVYHAGPIPKNPKYLNVHFMPRGEIEIEITNGFSNLKIKLPRFSPAYRNSSQNIIRNPEEATCDDAK